ncbi:MAG TPA: protein translocase subunit SecD [Actinobacteria bacterium]|nr:protein translocase subunit SecD [Actinomycetota bacterium]
MRRNKLNIVTVIIFCILLGLCIWSIITNPIKLGLDLRGGTQVILKPVEIEQTDQEDLQSEEETTGVESAAIDKAMLIILNRIDKLGISEPLVTKDYSNNIVIQLPGVEDPERAVDVIGKTAQLEFRILEGVDSDGNPQLGPVLITGDKLSGANAGYDNSGKVVVQFSFNSEGAQMFEKITSENIGKQLAIVLDGEIKSAPVIRAVISSDGVIENIGSLEEAKDIALVLQTGALPVNLEIQESRFIGPTLGRDSLQQSLIAGIIGLVLIAIFMVAVYRGFGAISVIGLVFYVVFFWGILSALKTPLTLPGIAGAILTVGMAVDANVLIFARTREEILKGKSKQVSLREGFKNALKAIIDSNITTLITAAALYRFGTGPIRGFSVTLAIGVILSMIVGLIFVRSILFLIINSRMVSPGFIGVKIPHQTLKEK